MAENAVKLAALRAAADRGWADLASGRYEDLPDESLDDFIGQLGLHAAQVQSAGQVRRPRHFLICRCDGDVLVIGRVLHDAMDLQRHVDPQNPWE